MSRLQRKMNYEVTAGMLHKRICLSIYLSIQLFTHPSIHLSSHPFLHPIIHPSVQLCACLFIVPITPKEDRDFLAEEETCLAHS